MTESLSTSPGAKHLVEWFGGKGILRSGIGFREGGAEGRIGGKV